MVVTRVTKSGKGLITKNIQIYNINTLDQLNEWCERASSSDFLSVDTEFKWENLLAAIMSDTSSDSRFSCPC